MLPVKIGSCINDGTNYTFYKDCGGHVLAQISCREGFSSVDSSSGLFVGSLKSAEKVQRLLKSCRFAPVYSSNKNCVEFKLRAIDRWEAAEEKIYPYEIEGSKVLSNGKVCSITPSGVAIWDPAREKEEIFPHEAELATIAESKCCELLLGDHNGNIYFKGAQIATGSEKKIEQIVALSEKRVLARVEGQVFLIHLKELKVERELDVGSSAEITNNGVIYHLQKGLTVHCFKGGSFVEHMKISGVIDFRLFEQTHLLLAEKKRQNQFLVTL